MYSCFHQRQPEFCHCLPSYRKLFSMGTKFCYPESEALCCHCDHPCMESSFLLSAIWSKLLCCLYNLWLYREKPQKGQFIAAIWTCILGQDAVPMGGVCFTLSIKKHLTDQFRLCSQLSGAGGQWEESHSPDAKGIKALGDHVGVDPNPQYSTQNMASKNQNVWPVFGGELCRFVQLISKG